MWVWHLILIAYIVFLLVLIYTIIIDYDDKNPVKTICWILVVIFLPLLGVATYYIVGRNVSKKRSKFRAWREEFNRHNQISSQTWKTEPIHPDHYKELKSLILNLEQSPVFGGNKISVYPGGKSKFYSLFEDIVGAQSHIHIFYYAIGDGHIGNEFKEKIIEKVKQGVKVRLIYDGLGCNKTNKKYFKQMIEAGVEVRTFLPLSFPRLLRSVNYRNHKKIVIIDGRIAYTGGINVKDIYIDGLPWGRWNDIHFKVEGSGASGLQSVFLADWYYASGQYLSAPEYYPEVEICGNVPVQVVNAEPLGMHSNVMEAMFTAISRAKKNVYIETPYFIPTEGLLQAIQTAAMSGIDVRLVMPKKSDNDFVQYASNSYVEKLLRNKVKVYQYLNGFTHSKLILIDDELVIAGSANMDIRSLELLFETNLFIYDKEVSQTVKSIYQDDMNNSKELHLHEWMHRSRSVKFREACFRLFSPVY